MDLFKKIALGYDECETMTGLSRDQISKLVKDGMPHFKLGGMYLFHYDSISDWLRRKTESRLRRDPVSKGDGFKAW